MGLHRLVFFRVLASKRNILLFALLMLALGTFAWLGREPSYKGAPLSGWLRSYHHNPKRTEEAVLKIGSDGLPTLLKMLKARQPTGFLSRVLTRVGYDIGNSAYSRESRLLAVRGIAILGDQAAPLIAELKDMVTDPECGPEVAQALRAIGPKARPLVEQYFVSTNAEIKRDAVRALWFSPGPVAANELFSLSTNADPVIRAEVFLGLPGRVPQFGDRVLKTI